MVKPFHTFLLAVCSALILSGCASSYQFVKVQPKPFPVTAGSSYAMQPIAASSLQHRSLASTGTEFYASPRLETRRSMKAFQRERNFAVQSGQEKIRVQAEKTDNPAGGAEIHTRTAPKDEVDKEKLNEELKKSSVFSGLPAKKFKKVEKLITRQADRLAEKKASSPAAPIGFNQWMRIGVILLLIGLVVGIAFADLGYLVAVIGIVFLVLGLIQQI